MTKVIKLRIDINIKIKMDRVGSIFQEKNGRIEMSKKG